ncbi:MAG: L-seryl-tRNA(Sec) selenium transferase [Vulcanimicrobiaceae bacterium]
MLRDLPAVNGFLAEPRIAGFLASFGSTAVKAAVDGVLEATRRAALGGGGAIPPFETLVAAVEGRLLRAQTQGLIEVINATGILLHTNLGRAPLADEALDAMRRIGHGYSNLEFDLDSGARGSRYERLGTLLRATTGADDSLVVNNCAAAILLILDTFAKGREVVVARNQLIEIGGGFRLPDVLARSGATLVEVGATNRVYLRDFERALTAQTALLLRSHPSNYRIDGFTAEVAGADLAALARRAGVPSVEDLGGGVLVDLETYGLPHERTVQEAVADGIDLIAFSGDKLLGGLQAGIIVGKRARIARMRANPLLRALRVDKTTIAGLAATLQLYLSADGIARIPFYAMLGASIASLRERAERLCASIEFPAARLTVVETAGRAGGGSLPVTAIPSIGLAIEAVPRNPNAIAAALRAHRPPVIARALDRSVVLDLRTVPPDRDAELAASIRAALTR